MKKLNSVEPFKYTYRVLNRLTGCSIGPFKTIKDAYNAGRATYRGDWQNGYYEFGEETGRIEYSMLDGKFIFWKEKDRDAKRLVLFRIEDESVVTLVEIREILRDVPNKYERKLKAQADDHDRSLDLIYRKHHPAKLKEDFCSERTVYHSRWSNTIEENWYRCKNIGNYHSITGGIASKKFDEAISSFEEEIEDYLGYNVKIHARRRFTMSLWNYERGNGAYDASKSWKHNSKRRKQWIPK